MSDAGAPPARRGPYAKTASRRAEIIASATAVFGAHGYRGGSMRQIAKDLGLGLTTVLHHFPTKAALLSAVLEQEDRSAPDSEERSRRDGFLSMVLGSVQRNLGRRELVRMFSIVAAEATYPEHEAHDWLVARYAAVTQSYTALIEHDRALGRIRSVLPADQLAALVISGWEGIQIRWLADGTDPVAAMRVLLEELLKPASED
ncbi:TetR/AcrR family transcriptional regulator [Microbacterium tumbae]